jgi:hypothetical protein
VALIFVVLTSGASGESLLVNGDFEAGDTHGWQVTSGELQTSTVAHSGQYGAAVISDGVEQQVKVYQSVIVQHSRTYELSGWVLMDDPATIIVTLGVDWFDANDKVTYSFRPQVTDYDAAYQWISTGELTPPADAVWARAYVTINGSAGEVFTVNLDDLSLTETEPPTPPATDTPSVPTDAPSSTPTASPTSTASPTPATPTPTASPAPTLSPTPSPRTPIPTPAEPRVFQQLANAGFEEMRDDDTPYAWRKVGGTLGWSARAHGGQRSLSLTSDSTSTKWAYQVVGVQPGAYYRAAAYAMQDNSRPGDIFLRVSWYASDDGSGGAISTDDSTQTISRNGNAFSLLQTDPLEVPAGARSAALRLMFRPADTTEATALFDDVSFMMVAPPTDRPATHSPSPSPAESAGDATPSPAVSPSPTHTSTPAPTPSAAATPTPATEPVVFPLLVNGGFETAREDGTPYGWHKIGGEIAVADEERVEGDLALAISSETSSTKWAYEAVSVTPGAFYGAEVWAMNTAGGDTLLLRISWYESDDAGGSAIDSVDSQGTVTGDAGGFRLLSTGPVQAPGDAHSARVRLLLEPASAASTRAFFDDVSFGETAAPNEANANGAAQTTPASRHTGAQLTVGEAADPPSPEVLAGEATPMRVANVRPAPRDLAQKGQDSGGSSMPWLALAILVPGVAIGSFGAEEVVRVWRRRTPASDD